MKIEIEIGGSKYAVERQEFNAELAFDDFLNLLFIAGIDIEQLNEIINTQKQNHKKNEQANPNSCNL